MRINPLSDLHFRHSPYIPAPMKRWADIRAIAGDFDMPDVANFDPELFLPMLDVDIIAILGNHDYDGYTLPDAKEAWRRFMHDVNALAQRRGIAGRLLMETDCGVHIIKGVRFVCATLWTDLDRNNPLAIEWISAKITKTDKRTGKSYTVTALSDFDRILGFTPAVMIAEHARHRAFLEDALAQPFNGPTWVMTHHAPTWSAVPARHRGNKLNAAYAVNLNHLIGGPEVTVWHHGHFHDSHALRLGDTLVLCNPRGYDDDHLRPNADFMPDLVKML